MSYQNVLDNYKFKTEFDNGLLLWNVFASPAKVVANCAHVQETNIAIKKRFRDEMTIEQTSFKKTMQEVEQQVHSLEELIDLNDVVNIAARVKEVEDKIAAAQAKVRLYNSREGLFDQDLTDYEDMNLIHRSFEPYSNLWQTAKEWIELSQMWTKGRFVDLNADEVEKNLEKYNIAINKAAKFFQKADLRQQSSIANKIKTQVLDFLPEVPLIVTLRNPGMRDRHWEKIAQQLGWLCIDYFESYFILFVRRRYYAH
jgi:dynein heavy chain